MNFKVKRKADGSIERHKAQLVVKNFYLRNWNKLRGFSSVMKFSSIRLLLAIVARLDLELHHMNVNIAFLNGELNKKINMKQLIGFVVKGQEKKACKLKDHFMV